MIRDLSERDLAVAVVEDGGRGGARSEEAHAAAAEPAKEAALLGPNSIETILARFSA